MKLIVGLGNPGEKYQRTRHNAGWHFLDYLLRHSGTKSERRSDRILSDRDPIVSLQDDALIKFKIEKKLGAEICQIEVNGEKIILVKPQTFMNESGRAVAKLILNFKFEILNLVVVHDDLDIRLGEFKIQKGRGPKLHYGIDSIEKHLGTKEFWRVRIGVDNRTAENRIPGDAYVLQNFTTEEIKILETVFRAIVQEFLI